MSVCEISGNPSPVSIFGLFTFPASWTGFDTSPSGGHGVTGGYGLVKGQPEQQKNEASVNSLWRNNHLRCYKMIKYNAHCTCCMYTLVQGYLYLDNNLLTRLGSHPAQDGFAICNNNECDYCRQEGSNHQEPHFICMQQGRQTFFTYFRWRSRDQDQVFPCCLLAQTEPVLYLQVVYWLPRVWQGW